MNASHDQNFDSGSSAGPAPDYFSPVDIQAAALTDASVLFTGMTERAEGIARQIHDSSGWRHGPFLVVDCTLPERVLDTILFGLLPAETRPAGDVSARLQPSQDGTIFLREVNALPRTTQIRLVDWLEHLRRPGRRGAWRRLMASTSEPLLGRISEGTFDDRLYYRLNVIHVVLPPADDVQLQD